MIEEIFTFFQNKRLFLILFLTLLFLTPIITSGAEHENKIVVNAEDTVYQVGSFGQKKAERLFYGLITINKGVQACADCHYLNYTDTLNWNPSAYDIAGNYAGKNIEDLLKVINNPAGTKLAEVHANYNITDEQAVLLQAYLEKLNQQEIPERKPLINNLLVFILINLIGLAALVDVLFTHKIPYRGIHLIILLGVTIFILKTLVVEGINTGRQQAYSPAQPIKFSHKIHAGQNQIDCQYCHNTAEQSKSAGIPSTNVCMNCHVIVVEGTQSGKFEIRKISEAQENKTPIEWIKVHNLPDHVFFSHAQHVKAGKLDCEECHGPVEEMDVIYQHAELSMGWCLDCHRTRSVDFEENDYYALYKEYHGKLKEGLIDSVLVQDIGGTNCMKCHY